MMISFAGSGFSSFGGTPFPIPSKYSFHSSFVSVVNSVSFNKDPDPAFYLNAVPDPDSRRQTNADPCESGSWSDFEKVEFYVKIMLTVLIIGRSKKFVRRYKSLFDS
jgi:hypothetical protein